jgi:hypothetical protein
MSGESRIGWSSATAKRHFPLIARRTSFRWHHDSASLATSVGLSSSSHPRANRLCHFPMPNLKRP